MDSTAARIAYFGSHIGKWDGGFFTTRSRALPVANEAWLDYSGSNTHGTPCPYCEEGTGRGT